MNEIQGEPLPQRYPDQSQNFASTQEPAGHPAPSQPVSSPAKTKAKRPGPRPMTDRDTKRFEGQLFPEQHIDLNTLLTRLGMENQNVPPSVRRRFTLNSLVRIGAEIVIDHGENIRGSSEEELLESLRKSIAEQPTKRRARRRPNL